MRLSLRFVLPLVFVFATFAYVLTSLVDNFTPHWSGLTLARRDLADGRQHRVLRSLRPPEKNASSFFTVDVAAEYRAPGDRSTSRFPSCRARCGTGCRA